MDHCDYIRAITRKLARGKFRAVYEAPSLGAVVKVPHPYVFKPGDELWMDPLAHARKEIATLRRIESDPCLTHLRRYSAKLLYGDETTGIVVMPRYRRLRRSRLRDAEDRIVGHVFRDSLGLATADYGLQNLMRDDRGKVVLVDFGY